jgi:hypothetical protein
MIDQFISMASQQLNISHQDAEEGTSGLLSLLKETAEPSAFSSLVSQMSGAQKLMNQYSVGNNLGGESSLTGGLLSAVGGMLSGQKGSQIAMMSKLVGELNLDLDQLTSLASLFYSFVKESLGANTADALMGGMEALLSGKQAA